MKTKFSSDIGHRIKEIRKDRGLTQERLAELIELTPQFLSLIEAEMKKPSVDTLIKIANALKVSPGDFFQPYKPDQHRQAHKGRDFKAIVGLLETLDDRELSKVRALIKVALKK